MANPVITADNLADARRLLKKRIADAQSGKPMGPQVEKTTFADLAKILIDDLKANGRKIKKRHAPLEHAREFFGDSELARNITTDRLTAFIAHRQEERAANATINRSLAALRRAFNLAKRAGRVVDVPYFPMLREDNAREGFLEQGQFLALRAELPDDLKGIVTFLWLTGWRVGEALTLGWDSVYADAIRLKATNSKNKHGRELPLVGELKEVIAHARASRTLDCPTVFSRDGKPIKSFVAAWRTACKDAGLGAVRVHDLRRSAARRPDGVLSDGLQSRREADQVVRRGVASGVQRCRAGGGAGARPAPVGGAQSNPRRCPGEHRDALHGAQNFFRVQEV